jgi:hypothetical protein
MNSSQDWRAKLAKRRGTARTRQLAFEAQAPVYSHAERKAMMEAEDDAEARMASDADWQAKLDKARDLVRARPPRIVRDV